MDVQFSFCVFFQFRCLSIVVFFRYLLHIRIAPWWFLFWCVSVVSVCSVRSGIKKGWMVMKKQNFEKGARALATHAYGFSEFLTKDNLRVDVAKSAALDGFVLFTRKAEENWEKCEFLVAFFSPFEM
jgi:hypothetical protein